MTIKRLGPGDAGIHCQVSMQYKEREITLEYSERFLADEWNYLVIALSENEVVGFVLAYEMQRVDMDRPMVMLYEIETREDYRRKGIGRAMMNELCGICRDRNALKMFVVTDSRNEPAKGFYSSTGGKMIDGVGVGFEYKDF